MTNTKTYQRATMATAAMLIGCGAQADITVEYVGHFGPAVASSLNDAGQIAGDYQLSGTTRAMRFDPGVGIIPLQVPAGTTQSLAIGINSSGTTVGRVSPPGAAPSFAALWNPDNSLTPMGIPAGTWSYATAVSINDAGVVAGFATLAQVGVDPESGFRWDAKNGFTLLPHLGGVVSYAVDINSAGVICGFSELAGIEHAVLWDAQNHIIDLGLAPGSTSTFATAISDGGVVIGGANADNNTWKWTQASGMVVLPDFGFKARALDINSSGWIIGWADVMPFESTPVVWDPQGNMYNLLDYVDQGQFYFTGDFINPLAINDDNTVVVYGYDFTVSGDPRRLIFSINAPNACPADVTGDSNVDIDDLFAVVGAWGVTGKSPTDITADGVVDIDDLFEVINAWGACG